MDIPPGWQNATTETQLLETLSPEIRVLVIAIIDQRETALRARDELRLEVRTLRVTIAQLRQTNIQGTATNNALNVQITSLRAQLTQEARPRKTTAVSI